MADPIYLIHDFIGKTAAEIAAWSIDARYKALGGAAGLLGQPQTAVSACPDGAGYYRHFAGGSIYYHPEAGAHEVHGLIRQYWADNGWERNAALGYPISDEQGVPGGGDRYSDFENGVVYWSAGAAKAGPLPPANLTVDGVKLSRTAAELVDAARPIFTAALSRLSGTTISAGPTFAGVTGYSFDGLSVHNRRYRVGLEVQVGPTLSLPLLGDQTSKVSLELQLEVAHDPIRGEIAGSLTGWALKSLRGNLAGVAAAQLPGALDPLLWSPHTLWRVPPQHDNQPLRVLAFKVLPSGDAEVYVQPPRTLTIHPGVLGTVVREALANTVTPAGR